MSPRPRVSRPRLSAGADAVYRPPGAQARLRRLAALLSQGLMSGVLGQILRVKRAAVRRRMDAAAIAAMAKRAEAAPPPRDFAAALRAREIAIIAEMKRASPSGGVLRGAGYDPAAIARAYQAGGAAALSVLTDARYFGGAAAHLRRAKAACDLPVLRKDFIVHRWQIFESRALGADAILLIAAALPPADLGSFARLARALRMAALLEVHDLAELNRALPIAAADERILIGINNRDLRTLQTDLNTTATLARRARGRFLVAESGIQTAADIARLRAAGAGAFLIGESLLRAKSPVAKLRALLRAAA